MSYKKGVEMLFFKHIHCIVKATVCCDWNHVYFWWACAPTLISVWAYKISCWSRGQEVKSMLKWHLTWIWNSNEMDLNSLSSGMLLIVLIFFSNQGFIIFASRSSIRTQSQLKKISPPPPKKIVQKFPNTKMIDICIN